VAQTGRTVANTAGALAVQAGQTIVARQVPYSWGGGNTKGPTLGTDQGAHTVGFDCSSFAQYIWAKQGVAIPRTTYGQIKAGKAVASIAQAQPGDLLFPSTGHVQIYIGNGHVIEEPHTGGHATGRPRPFQLSIDQKTSMSTASKGVMNGRSILTALHELNHQVKMVRGPKAGPGYQPIPKNAAGAQRLVNRARRYIESTYRDERFPLSMTTVRPGSIAAYRGGVAADSNPRTGLIRFNDPAALMAQNTMGAEGAYRGSSQQTPLQILLHELNHQVGQGPGNTTQDRLWEEGLATAVARDQAPGFARTLSYVPSPSANQNNDFNFTAPVYPKQTAAVDTACVLQRRARYARMAWKDEPRSNLYVRSLPPPTAHGEHD